MLRQITITDFNERYAAWLIQGGWAAYIEAGKKLGTTKKPGITEQTAADFGRGLGFHG